MKKNLLLICCAILFLFSPGCTKDTVSEKPTSIVGKWELKQTMGNTGTVDYPSGNGFFLEFTGSAYSTTNLFVPGNHPDEGDYQIIADTSVNNSTGIVVPSGQFSNRIILNKDTVSEKIFYQISSNKLIILSGYFPLDGGVQLTYEKQ